MVLSNSLLMVAENNSASALSQHCLAQPTDRRTPDARCQGGELLTGAPTAAIRVKDHRTGETTLAAGGPESAGDQFGPQVIGGGPADHAAGSDVESSTRGPPPGPSRSPQSANESATHAASLTRCSRTAAMTTCTTPSPPWPAASPTEDTSRKAAQAAPECTHHRATSPHARRPAFRPVTHTFQASSSSAPHRTLRLMHYTIASLPEYSVLLFRGPIWGGVVYGDR